MSLDQIPISPINARKSSKGSTKPAVIPSDNILMGGNIVTKKFKKTRKQFDVKFQTFNSQEAVREDLRNFLLINFVKLKDSVYAV